MNRVRTADALAAFLATPATAPKGLAPHEPVIGLTNELVIVSVCGARGVNAPDPALYGDVSSHYEMPCITFADAFKACAQPKRGWVDWERFDLATLRAAHAAFGALQLPAAVEDAEQLAELSSYFEMCGAAAETLQPVKVPDALECYICGEHAAFGYILGGKVCCRSCRGEHRNRYHKWRRGQRAAERAA